MVEQDIYTVGGTVQAGGGRYIPRAADEELLALCRAGTFAYVLAPRQMGKSSLMLRTVEQLAVEGIRSVIIDLTSLGVQLNAEKWYLGMLFAIRRQLRLKTDVVKWWQAQANLGMAQRLTLFSQEVLLAEIAQPVVIFVDEIDTTLSLDFTDDFYAAIRYFYNARAHAPEFGRLSFVLIGVATPSELINDPKRTPFNIGQRVDLDDFTFEEALPLADGLQLPTDNAQQTLRWVLDWTHGHPYLTQRLCATIANQELHRCTRADVAQAVAGTFLGEMSGRDDNLLFVGDMLTKRAPDPAAVLSIYRAIRQGWMPVRDQAQSPVHTHLKLSGVVRRDGDVLRVRNRIYERVFDMHRVRELWPANWWQLLPSEVKVRGAVVIITVLAVLLLVSVPSAINLATERAKAEAARQVAEKLRDQAASDAFKASARSLSSRALLQANDRLDVGFLVSLEANRALDTLDIQADLMTVLGVNPQLRTYLRGHSSAVYSVAFSSDGKLLASGGADKNVILWEMSGDVPVGKTLAGHTDIVGHTDVVRAVAFSPDGKLLASGSLDRTVIIWDVATGQPIRQLHGHNKGIRSIAISPDGMLLASGSLDETIILWDLTTGAQVGEPIIGHTALVGALAFSPDGKQLAAGDDDSNIIVWSVENHRPLFPALTDHTTWVLDLEYSPDGKWLASASGDHTIIIWDPQTGQSVGAPLRGHSSWVHDIVFSPDGRTLVSAGEDATIRLWDVASRTQVGEPIIGHNEAVLGLAFSPDGTLASSSADATVILWNLAARHRLAQTFDDHQANVRTVAFSPDGKLLASADESGAILLRDAGTGRSFGKLDAQTDEIRSAAFSPDGKLLALAGCKQRDSKTKGCRQAELSLWDLVTKQLVYQLTGHTDIVETVAFSPDGTRLASGSNDNTVILWNVKTGRKDKTLQRHRWYVLSVAFSPDGKWLASGSWDGTVRLWDVATGQSQKLAHPKLSLVDAVAFSPDGNRLVAGGFPNMLVIWDVNDPQSPGISLIGHRISVNALAFRPDGKLLVSGSNDGAILVWDVANRQLIGQLRGHSAAVRSLAFRPDGKALASGGADQRVMLWDFDLESWKRRACSVVNRNLTREEWAQFIGDKAKYHASCPGVQ
jgi:WD40 repeat protein